MVLAPRIEVRQSQALVMTPQLQQAIKLLQMSNLELAEFLSIEVEKNPLLELVPPSGLGPVGGSRGHDASALEMVAVETSLQDHLHAQLGTMHAKADVLEAAHILADELEDDGYLRAAEADVAERHRLARHLLAAGLRLVQSCDPPGVGARSLAECLALQLRDLDRLDPAMVALLANLSLAAAGRHAELRSLCGVDAEDLSDMLAELRALDPKPGLRFAIDSRRLEVRVPDVHVRRAADGGGWVVELNAETLPRLLVNNRYLARAGAGAEAKAFLADCMASARWLARSLDQRAKTILRVAQELVERQERFFAEGVAELRPLTQRAVAMTLGLHESTVSRAAAGKYVSCTHGCFDFRFFFSSSIQAVSGGEAFSATAVQERMRGLIHNEPARAPLSDDRIVAALNAEGIDIARRTVAKYREGMGIPSSVERRRLKSSQAKP